MKNPIIAKLLFFSGILILLVLTYYRENLALQINAYLNGEIFSRAYAYQFSNYFKTLPKNELKQWKWMVSIGFALVISVVTLLSLYSWFQSYSYIRFTVVIYLTVGIIFSLFAVIAYATHSFDEIYLLLRRVLGVIQSPIPLFIFFTLFYYTEKKMMD